MGSTGFVSPNRRSLLKAAGIGAASVAAIPLLSSCTGEPARLASSASVALLPAPPGQIEPLLDRAKVTNALAKLDGLVGDAMDSTGLSGMAVAVVYRDEVVYSKGFGVREVGKPEEIGPDTVFQVASLSKPLASTVVAGLVGQQVINWTDAVIEHNRNFALKDDYVTRNASFADLLSHRSGLKTGSGDLLEDLGFDRAYILGHLHQEPLDTFRSSYNYSNFGYTEAGQAAADAMERPGKIWPTRSCSGSWACPPAVTVIRTMSEPRTRPSFMCRSGTRSGQRNTAATPIPRLRPGARARRCGTWPSGSGCSSETAVTRAIPLLIRLPSKPPTFPMQSPARHRLRLPGPVSTAWAGTSPTMTRPVSSRDTPGRLILAQPPPSRCFRVNNWPSWSDQRAPTGDS